MTAEPSIAPASYEMPSRIMPHNWITSKLQVGLYGQLKKRNPVDAPRSSGVAGSNFELNKTLIGKNYTDLI